jgi:nudix-type nucleoside diphosphatase (YffH/AdpP family)
MPETLNSTHPFRGKIVSVRLDEVRLEDGHVTRQEVVEHRDSMTVVALDSENRLVLVKQYRHAVGEELLETPAGSVDEGETAEQSVNRELAEETGLCAHEVVKLGSFYLAPGWATEHMHVYLARNLYESAADADEDERIEVVRLPIPEWEAKIAAGEIRDAKSIAAWHMAVRVLDVRS